MQCQLAFSVYEISSGLELIRSSSVYWNSEAIVKEVSKASREVIESALVFASTASEERGAGWAKKSKQFFSLTLVICGLSCVPFLAWPKAAFRIHFHVEVSTLQMPRMLSDGFCCRWQLSINFVMTISCRSSSGREEESES